MKKIYFLLLLVMLFKICIAETFEYKNPGDIIEEDGWNISIERVFSDKSVLFKVWSNETDAKIKKIAYQTQESIKGVKINVTEVFYSSNQNYTFVSFTTTILWKHDCNKDSDCDDGDPCTIDRCTGTIPRSCNNDDSHQQIKYCKNNDGCCPTGCTWLKDNDCPKFPCKKDSDCDDKNASTKDICVNEECKFTEITECISGDNYCPNNCSSKIKYSENYDSDCSKYSKCISHSDCDDKNASTIDICWNENSSTEPKYCQHIINETYIASTNLINPTIKQNNETINSSNKSKRMIWVKPKKLTKELKKKANINWKLIIIIIIILVIYLFICFKILINKKKSTQVY